MCHLSLFPDFVYCVLNVKGKQRKDLIYLKLMKLNLPKAFLNVRYESHVIF